MAKNSTKVKFSLKNHIASKHKKVLHVPGHQPTPCRFDGCLNIVDNFSNPLATLCPTCQLKIKEVLRRISTTFKYMLMLSSKSIYLNLLSARNVTDGYRKTAV